MSYIGKKKIICYDSIVKIKVKKQSLYFFIFGTGGLIRFCISRECKVSVLDAVSGFINVHTRNFLFKRVWGTYTASAIQAITGVRLSVYAYLQLVGVGFKIEINKDFMLCKLGFSHLIYLPIPKGIRIKLLKKNIFSFNGANAQKILEFVAQVKNIKKPDIYKGKGFRFLGEHIKLKPGKRK